MLASLLASDAFQNSFATLKPLLPIGMVRRASPFLDRATARVNADLPVLEAILGHVEPTLSFRRILARVVEVRRETPDVTTFVMRPNARFGSYRPGSYVTVHRTIDGKKVARAYSLSSAPSNDGLVAITVKRVEGGLFSNHLADTLGVGDVLELGAPEGRFVLPERPPSQLLLLSAGSGITPVMSMLRHLVKSGATTEVDFVHFARTPKDVIFAEELARIARRSPNVRVTVCVEQADASWTGAVGRFGAAMLEHAVPGFREVETYLCGPAGFMQAVMQTFERTGADLSKLRYERFDVKLDASAFLEHAQVVRFTRSKVEALSNRPLTILAEAEAHGVRVQSGCRAGTCGTCKCKKKAGVIVNLATGQESGSGEETIYPCVSVARGTVEIDL